MNLNPLTWIDWLITEHGSANVLRQQLSLSRQENATLKTTLEECQTQKKSLETNLLQKQVEIDDLKKRITKPQMATPLMSPMNLDKPHHNYE
jgi:septal ring factor EnvC (AmiA/AmiB activator)